MTTDIPKYDAFFRPVILALHAMGSSGSINEIDDRIASDLRLGPDTLDQTYKKTGVSIVADRIAWARSHLKIAGLADNPSRGVWVLAVRPNPSGLSGICVPSHLSPLATSLPVTSCAQRSRRGSGRALDRVPAYIQ
ncbi:winged helix-turn-helix domain-containing protein [Aurantimonas sp. C2-5-R2]|uniref:winged helix-turn-helix domain-containing protein n=1 Tax=Aurantimonas sp. C2-5-R2 TaxID=3113713 RepID=UPI002F92947A